MTGNQLRERFDAFISYRRETGADDARLLQQALKARGYNVFFDFDSLRDGKFDQKIFDAIDEAPVFILMLTKGALDKCANEDDWVRQEIELAIEKQRVIVPVQPSNQNFTYPDQLPVSIKAIRNIQNSELNKASLFEVSVDKIINDRFPSGVHGIKTKPSHSGSPRQKGKKPTKRHAATPSTSSVPKKKELTRKSKGALVVCPVCGKKNNPEGTFQCRECGRDNLCLRHQDDGTYLCCDCVSKTRKTKVGRSTEIQGGDGLSCPSVEVRNLGGRHACFTNAAALISKLESAVEARYKAEGCRVQSLPFEENGNSGALIQIQPPSSNVNRYLSLAMGMDYCVSVKLLRAGGDLEIEVFAGKWIKNVFAAVVSWLTLWPFAAGALVGVYRQKKFLDAVYDDAIQWMSSHCADAH